MYCELEFWELKLSQVVLFMGQCHLVCFFTVTLHILALIYCQMSIFLFQGLHSGNIGSISGFHLIKEFISFSNDGVQC